MLSGLTILVGLALSGGGIYGYINSGMTSFTPLIPLLPAVLILICGLVSLNAAKRSTWLMGAQLLAFVTLIFCIPNALKISEVLAGTADRPFAVWLSVGFAAIVGVYLLITVPATMLTRTKVPARV
ncbi:MAG: hypothetical protein WBA28_06085 [Microbacteriaceae bacterium]